MQNITSSEPQIGQLYWGKSRRGQADNVGEFYHRMKRFMDLGITILALTLLWPVLLLIALLIWLDSPGSVIFVQKRVGARRRVKGNTVVWEIEPFMMYKFRSMHQDADQSLHVEHIKAYVAGDLEAHNDDNEPRFKLAHDPRITRVGHWIRKTSLDELPQLWNVLKGDMSLVGPRPVPEYEVALYREEHYERLSALPGLTGLWQVVGRGEVTFEEMIRLDVEYVRTRTIGLDLWILLKTVPAALQGEGAA